MADEMIVLTPDEYNEVGAVVRDFRRRRTIIPAPGLRRPLPLKSSGGDGRIWHDFRNDSGETIPARAALEIKTGVSDGNEYLEDGTPILVVDKPSTPHMHPWHCPINNDNEVEADAYGKCTFDPTWAFVDATFSTVIVHDALGTVAGEWYLRESQYGFRALSGEYPGAETDDAKVMVAAYDPPHWANYSSGTKAGNGKVALSGNSSWGITMDNADDSFTIVRDGRYEIKWWGYAEDSTAAPSEDFGNFYLRINGADLGIHRSGYFSTLKFSSPANNSRWPFYGTIDADFDEATEVELWLEGTASGVTVTMAGITALERFQAPNL